MEFVGVADVGAIRTTRHNMMTAAKVRVERLRTFFCIRPKFLAIRF